MSKKFVFLGVLLVLLFLLYTYHKNYGYTQAPSSSSTTVTKKTVVVTDPYWHHPIPPPPPRYNAYKAQYY
jgi:hypothetical protein